MNFSNNATGSKPDPSRPDARRVDLSKLPEPMRSMVLRQMEKMPEQMREQLLRGGSPLLDRVIAKAREREDAQDEELPATDASSISPDRIQTVRHASGSAAPLRVQTVSPGDAANGSTWLFVCLIVLVGAILIAMHGG
jgi:hypothetical protein